MLLGKQTQLNGQTSAEERHLKPQALLPELLLDADFVRYTLLWLKVRIRKTEWGIVPPAPHILNGDPLPTLIRVGEAGPSMLMVQDTR